MDSEKSRGNPESATQSALDFLRESLGAMPPGGGSRRWRFQREATLLQEWAQLHVCCLSEVFLQDFRAVSSGAEHEVFFDQSHQRAIKVTRGGSFGHSMVGEGQSALPSEYLQRVIHHNEILGDNILLLGIFSGEGNPRVVTSQPWITEKENAQEITESDVDEYFKNLGFRKSPLGEVPAFFNVELELMVLDANLKNILRDSSGDLFPIDVVIGKPSPQLLQKFGF